MKNYSDKETLVSIIVPVYNTPVNYLEKCFNSILNQSYKNIEIIIVNDGSSKEITDFCNDFFRNYDNCKIIYQENSGVSVARNNGIKNSSGSYISFIDSDDYIEENYIEEMLKKIYKNKADIIFTSANKMYSNKKEKQIIKECNKDFLVCNKENKEFSPYNLDLMGTVWGKLYKKSVIENIEFNSNLKIGEDIDFNFRVFNSNLKYLYINSYSYNYVINDKSVLRGFNLDKIESYEKTLEAIKSYIENIKDKDIKNTYYLWGCTFYRVIAMNYVFNKKNEMTFKEKVQFLKDLKEKSVYKECLEKANLKILKFSRRLPIYLIRNNFFIVLYVLIKIREFEVK